MFYNLNIAFRNLRRNGLYSLINVAGLAVGLTTVILIMLWVWDEWSFDKFHKNEKNLYRINISMGDLCMERSTGPLPIFAKAEIPEVDDYCRTSGYHQEYADYDNKKFYGNQIAAVDTTFFTLFDFPLLEGDRLHPFKDAQSIIISETKAGIIFGTENPIGKVIRLSNNISFQVTGVMKDMPKNSSMQYDMLVPFEILNRQYSHPVDEDWGNNSYESFLLLRPETDIRTVAAKLGDVATDRLYQAYPQVKEMGYKVEYLLQPLANIHLYAPDGKPAGMEKIYLFSVIAVLILLIACINYVNLVTARSSKRGKEMAIRKIAGAKLPGLFRQLMEETAMLLLVSLAITVLLVYLLLPFYNNLSGKEMTFQLFSAPTLLIFGITALCVLCLTGIYPAILLGSFKPVEAFGRSTGGKSKHAYLRKGLVVLQFAISFILVVSTLGFSAQIRYMQQKDLGYNSKNVFTMWSINMNGHYDAVRDELLKNKNIVEVTAAEARDMSMNSYRKGAFWPGKPDDLDPRIHTTRIRSNFIDCMNLELVAGEKFSAVDSFAIIINEEAARVMNMQDPVGQPFYMNKGDKRSYTIKGVVKDFHFDKLDQKIEPAVMIHSFRVAGAIYVKTVPGGAQSALETAEKLWKQYNPDAEFTYQFERLYKTDRQMEQLLSIFSLIAILISCLGLLGLVTYTAEMKTKEIGIRKVLGATISNIITMLSKEFLLLLGIAMLIAFPLGYVWLDTMLQDYAYRIPVSWWIFVLTVLATLALTLLTAGWKAWQAATANPVNSIKTE